MAADPTNDPSRIPNPRQKRLLWVCLSSSCPRKCRGTPPRMSRKWSRACIGFGMAIAMISPVQRVKGQTHSEFPEDRMPSDIICAPIAWDITSVAYLLPKCKNPSIVLTGFSQEHCSIFSFLDAWEHWEVHHPIRLFHFASSLFGVPWLLWEVPYPQ